MLRVRDPRGRHQPQWSLCPGVCCRSKLGPLHTLGSVPQDGGPWGRWKGAGTRVRLCLRDGRRPPGGPQEGRLEATSSLSHQGAGATVMVEANSCPSLCSRGQPTLPAPGAHGGASLAGAADSEAAVTRPGLELDTMTGEPRASRDPTERPPAPPGWRWGLGLLPLAQSTHCGPCPGAAWPVGKSLQAAENPGPAASGEASVHTGSLSICERPAGLRAQGARGQQGRATIPAQKGGGIRKAGAWGRSWLPRGEPGGGAPGQRPVCAVGTSAPGPERADSGARAAPSWPGYRRPPETRPHCRRRARGPRVRRQEERLENF